MTFREFCLRALAHERLEISKWQHTRFLALKILEPYLDKKAKVTVFDILPLPGDPTPEDLKASAEQKRKEQISVYEQKKAQYVAMGLITENK